MRSIGLIYRVGKEIDPTASRGPSRPIKEPRQ